MSETFCVDDVVVHNVMELMGHSNISTFKSKYSLKCVIREYKEPKMGLLWSALRGLFSMPNSQEVFGNFQLMIHFTPKVGEVEYVRFVESGEEMDLEEFKAKKESQTIDPRKKYFIGGPKPLDWVTYESWHRTKSAAERHMLSALRFGKWISLFDGYLIVDTEGNTESVKVEEVAPHSMAHRAG